MRFVPVAPEYEVYQKTSVVPFLYKIRLFDCAPFPKSKNLAKLLLTVGRATTYVVSPALYLSNPDGREKYAPVGVPLLPTPLKLIEGLKLNVDELVT